MIHLAGAGLREIMDFRLAGTQAPEGFVKITGTRG